MKASTRITALACCTLASAIVCAAPIQADAGGVSCHAIDAKGAGQDLGGGMTQAQIMGGGLLHGTTQGSFVITGVSGTVASIAGTVVFTVNRAALTVTVAGTLDVASGAFTASGPVSASSGKLAGATGSLSLSGVENLADGSFVEDVTGAICAELAP
jgi:hypothetical protein